MTPSWLRLLMVLFLATLLVACGSDDDGNDVDDEPDTEEP